MDDRLSRNVAPIIGLHAHGWDDEPYERPTPTRLAHGWDDEPSERSTATRLGRRWASDPTLQHSWQEDASGETWQSSLNEENWRHQDTWAGDTHSSGWEADIPTDSDIWRGPSHQTAWPDRSLPDPTSLWTNAPIKPQNGQQFMSIWGDHTMDGTWMTNPTKHSTPVLGKNSNPPSGVNDNAAVWEGQISHLRNRIIFLEQQSRMYEANFQEIQRQYDLLERDLTNQLGDKMQQIVSLEVILRNLHAEIHHLKGKLELQENQSLLLSITDKLSKLSLFDLEEVSLHTQELLVKKKKEQRESRLCVVCIDQEKTNLVVPCGHFCLCENCAEQLPRPVKCPVCRGGAREVVRVYT